MHGCRTATRTRPASHEVKIRLWPRSDRPRALVRVRGRRALPGGLHRQATFSLGLCSGTPPLVGTWVGPFTTRSGKRLAMLIDMQLVPLGRDRKGTPIIRTERHGWLDARVLVCDGPGRVRHLEASGKPNDNRASRFHLATSPTDSAPPPEGACAEPPLWALGRRRFARARGVAPPTAGQIGDLEERRPRHGSRQDTAHPAARDGVWVQRYAIDSVKAGEAVDIASAAPFGHQDLIRPNDSLRRSTDAAKIPSAGSTGYSPSCTTTSSPTRFVHASSAGRDCAGSAQLAS